MSLLLGDEKITHLYKYRASNDHTLENLAKKQLRFSYPKEFNDPFDCAINMIFNGSREDWSKWIASLNLPTSKQSKIEDYLASNDYDGSSFDQSNLPEDINLFLILAVSEVHDHILLWSHYADNHKGICLGFGTRIEGNSLGIIFDEPSLTFRVSGVTKGFLPMRKVKYSKNMPAPYNRLKDSDRKLMEFTVAKHSDWEYEAERRIVLPRSMVGTQMLRYHDTSLERVIFGYRTDKDYRQQIVDIVRKNYKKGQVELYQTKRKADQYALIVQRI